MFSILFPNFDSRAGGFYQFIYIFVDIYFCKLKGVGGDRSPLFQVMYIKTYRTVSNFDLLFQFMWNYVATRTDEKLRKH